MPPVACADPHPCERRGWQGRGKYDRDGLVGSVSREAKVRRERKKERLMTRAARHIGMRLGSCDPGSSASVGLSTKRSKSTDVDGAARRGRRGGECLHGAGSEVVPSSARMARVCWLILFAPYVGALALA